MGAGPLVTELLLVFVFTCFVLHKYGNWRKQHVVVTLSTLVGWYFSFIIVFILPLDVVLAFYYQCISSVDTNHSVAVAPNLPANHHSSNTSTGSPVGKSCNVPRSYVPPNVLPSLWRVVYWTSQALTWLILPIMQSYSHSGEFKVLGKLKASLRENAIYYGSYLLIFGILLIYVAFTGFPLSPANLKVICITASNTWGLTILVVLLGYGLVEIPRKVWYGGAKGYQLQRTYFELEKLSTEKHDAEETLRDVYAEANGLSTAVKEINPYRPYVDVIMSKFPKDSQSITRRLANQDYRDSEAANMPTESLLVGLHKRVIRACHDHHRTQAQWNALLETAFHLEDVAKNEQNASKTFARAHPIKRGIITDLICTPALEWYWECVIKRPLMRVLGVVLAITTAFIVWSEVTFFNKKPVLSLAAVFVKLAANSYNYTYIQLSSILFIAYLCVCAYYTVFQVKVYRYYHLDPHHQTDENSLLFSAILLCRLTPPLCLNFLGLIHMDSHVADQSNVETAYTKIMGHMDVISIISSGFNVYFPMGILLLCLGTYFRLGTKCLHFLGFDQFMEDDEMTVELVQAGKALIQTERNRMQRNQEREARHDFWEQKLGSRTANRNLREGESRYSQPEYGDRARMVENAEPVATEEAYRDSVNENDSIMDYDSWNNSNNNMRRSSSGRSYGTHNNGPGGGIFDDI